MRKIIVLSFVTLDGVMQAPGGPEEDSENNFRYGGWSAPYADALSAEEMDDQMKPTDMLLGRKTFDIFEEYWPKHAAQWPGVNEVTKYVFSNTVSQSEWQNCVFIKSVEELKALKNTPGGDINVWGSGELTQLLMEHDLVDEFKLKIYPIVLGHGKKLFGSGTQPAAFKLTKHTITSLGVIFANYSRDGEVKTGTVGD